MAAWTWTIEHVNGPILFFPVLFPLSLSVSTYIYPSWSFHQSIYPMISRSICIILYYIILINMYLGLGLLQFISLLVFDSLWLSIATPKSYSVDVKLLQDVLKLLKWQLSALCRPVKVGATRNYKVVWRDVYTSVQSTCIGIFNKCLCILCQGMPTLTISSRQQTLSSRRLILSVESHGSEVFWVHHAFTCRYLHLALHPRRRTTPFSWQTGKRLR